MAEGEPEDECLKKRGRRNGTNGKGKGERNEDERYKKLRKKRKWDRMSKGRMKKEWKGWMREGEEDEKHKELKDRNTRGRKLMTEEGRDTPQILLSTRHHSSLSLFSHADTPRSGPRQKHAVPLLSGRG